MLQVVCIELATYDEKQLLKYVEFGRSQKFSKFSVFIAAEGSDDIISSSRSAVLGSRGGGSSSLDSTVEIEEHNN